MNFRRLTADLTAGLTVSFAAISLGAAFGVMSGRGAFAGMMGAAVIPIIASLFGGTRIQASGPTAPMTAVSALVVAFAYDSFPDRIFAEQFITLVFIMNALFLVVAGLVGLGKLIRMVPNVVILGFMNGIALLIWVDQFTKVFAIGSDASPMKGGIAVNLVIAVITFALIFAIIWAVKKTNVRPQIRSFISGVLWSIILMTVVALIFGMDVEKVKLGATLESFGDFTAILINYFPSKEIFTGEYLWMAMPFALQLTLLAYLDSLLTALVVDRMTHEQSKLNKELVAQGLANAASGLLQGIPGAQATIRSVLLIKEGAMTRLAGVMIGVFALVSILLFKDYLVLVPAAVFVGVLLKVGLDVADKDFVMSYFRQQWIKSRKRNIQFLFIIYTTAVTVIVNLNVAVISGTILFFIARALWKVEDVEADLNADAEEKEGGNDDNKNQELITHKQQIDHMDATYNALLDGNKKWVETRLEQDPDFFYRLSKGQKPEVLWIGCSDSRVPANEITGTRPGDIFVHRNIANMVIHTDMSMLSVLDYAVNVLKVKHVIVCGHYGCGGVKAAMEREQVGLIDNWLRFIKDVYRIHADELDMISDQEQRFRRLVELNVIEQVLDLTKTSIIQNAWTNRNEPRVHGWVYDLGTGIINDLGVSFDSTAKLPDIYRIESPVVSS